MSSAREKLVKGGLIGGVGVGIYGAYSYLEKNKLKRTALSEAYDYIIVGGGTSGCVLASRLSEDPSVTVLVLEAGDSDQNEPKIHVPAAAFELQRTQVDWAFVSEPNKELNGRASRWPRGKVLGGSSCLNWMLWVRGHPADWDAMERLHGCEGWGYRGVEEHFRSAERVSFEVPDPAARGHEGPLHLQQIASPNHYSGLWMDAAQQSGLPLQADYNSGRMFGCSVSQLAIKAGKRVSAASAYLHDTGALQRPNLHVKCGVHVTRVLFEGSPPRAVGVEYQQAGQPRSVKQYVLAQREVAVCAGAVQSPQLLMLSGVGDREELAEQELDCLAHLPGVGKNLQDHVFVPLMQHATKPLTMDLGAFDKLLALTQYLLARSGPASSQALECMAFLNSAALPAIDQALPVPPVASSLAPDLQLHFVCAGASNPYAMENLGYPKEFNADVALGISTLPTLLHPKSTGTIRLDSPDPFAAPVIDPNYLSHPDDLDLLVKGVKLARRIHSSGAFQGFLGAEAIDPDLANRYHPLSDDYIREYVRKTAVTVYHPVGTCKIGQPNDPMAVVDPQCRVYGCVGLRVVDCSIFPVLMGANTYAPAVMAGEKVASLIKSSPPPPLAHPTLALPKSKL